MRPPLSTKKIVVFLGRPEFTLLVALNPGLRKSWLDQLARTLAWYPFAAHDLQRFAPIWIGPTKVTIAEDDERRMLTIDVNIGESEYNSDDDNPPRGGGRRLNATTHDAVVTDVFLVVFVMIDSVYDGEAAIASTNPLDPKLGSNSAFATKRSVVVSFHDKMEMKMYPMFSRMFGLQDLHDCVVGPLAWYQDRRQYVATSEKIDIALLGLPWGQNLQRSVATSDEIDTDVCRSHFEHRFEKDRTNNVLIDDYNPDGYDPFPSSKVPVVGFSSLPATFDTTYRPLHQLTSWSASGAAWMN
jgi:hypothetical protein